MTGPNVNPIRTGSALTVAELDAIAAVLTVHGRVPHLLARVRQVAESLRPALNADPDTGREPENAPTQSEAAQSHTTG